MQRIAQRVERAHRSVVRRAAKKQRELEAGEKYQRTGHRRLAAKQTNELIRQSRQNRRVDWECGPLAPRRDVGEKEESYGTVPLVAYQFPDAEPQDRPKATHIAEGDRVVVMKGIDKGRIGVVSNLDLTKASVTVRGLNQASVQIPVWMQMQEDSKETVTTISQMMKLEDVKLVYPLPDPKTGIPRDVIIDRMTLVDRHFNEFLNEQQDGYRIIPGTKTIIPWPAKADPFYDENEDDTVRLLVDEETFRPFLIRPPMPLSVIDELRGKYSRFRTRHDFDYVAKKELEDARMEQRQGLISTMRTPLQELAEVRAKQKQEQAKDLTPEQLAKIGEVIAQKRAKSSSVEAVR